MMRAALRKRWAVGAERKQVTNAWVSVAGQVEEQLPDGCGETEVAVYQVNMSPLFTDLNFTGPPGSILPAPLVFLCVTAASVLKPRRTTS